jgi:hypothetical protein
MPPVSLPDLMVPVVVMVMEFASADPAIRLPAASVLASSNALKMARLPPPRVADVNPLIRIGFMIVFPPN